MQNNDDKCNRHAVSLDPSVYRLPVWISHQCSFTTWLHSFHDSRGTINAQFQCARWLL